MLLLYKAGQWTKKSSYKEVVAATFGDAVVPVLVAMQFSFPFMAMMSYQIIISDNLSTIVKSIGTILAIVRVFSYCTNIVLVYSSK